MRDRGPAERGETVRETLRKALREGPATARDLSSAAGIREKDVAEHLGHLARSLPRTGERLVVEPASCVACGHRFTGRARLTRPGACPECRSTRIDPPVFRIEATGAPEAPRRRRPARRSPLSPASGGALAMAATADCVFCKIVARQLPAAVVHEDDRVLAFMDIGQVNPGHVLVALKAHVEDVFALDDAQAAAVFRCASRVARAVRAAFAPHGLSIYQANGAAAGQTVPHFHLHVLPRWKDDGIAIAWPVKNPPREKLEEYAEMIRANVG